MKIIKMTKRQILKKSEERAIEVIESMPMSQFRVSGKAQLDGQETVALYMKNISATRDIKITKIVHQMIVPKITGFPNQDNYFFISIGRQLERGGDATTPMNIDGDRQAGVSCLDSNPVLTREGDEIDRWYTQAVGDRNVWEDELILKPQDTLSLSYQSGQGGGIIRTRVSFGN